MNLSVMQMSAAGILKFFAAVKKCGRRQVPKFRFFQISVARQEDVGGMPRGPQPGDETNQIAFRHGGAAGGRARGPGA